MLKNKSNNIKRIISVLLTLILGLVLVACSDDEAKKFKVQFRNVNLEDVLIEEGKTLNEPSESEIEGGIVLGWFKDANLTIEFDFSIAITENTIIYAHFLEGIKVSISEALNIGKDLEHSTSTTTKYFVNGKIKSISNAEYGNMIITDGENDLSIYGVWELGKNKRYDELSEKPIIGDIVYLYGPVQRFNETIEIKDSELIRFHADTTEPGFDINDYKDVTINEARLEDIDSKVLIKGVVAQKNLSNGFNPAGIWVVDETGSIYVYDIVIASSVDIGDEVVIAGVRANFILATEQHWAEQHGYEGAIQITKARLIETKNTNLEFNKEWIKETTVKEVMETDYKVENITGSIHKVNAFINKVVGTGFTNYYINDLDNKTGSYVYTMNNGNDYDWLDEYDGQLRVVYFSVINARSNASGILYRFIPIAIGEKVEYDDSYNSEYAVIYEGRGQFETTYFEGHSPDITLKQLVNNEKLGINNVELTYSSSNEDVVYFEEIDGKLIFKTGTLGKTTITISSTANGITYSENFEVEVIKSDEAESLTVFEAINQDEGETVVIKGIVAASLVNQSGFFLIDESGMVAVRMPSSELEGVSIGNEVIIEGTKTHVRGSKDPSEAIGQLVIDKATIVTNLQGNYNYSEASFKGENTLENLNNLNVLEEHSTSVWRVEGTVKYTETPYYTRYELEDGTNTYNIYSGSGSQLSFLEPYIGQTLEFDLTVVNWNGNGYRLAIIAVIVNGKKIPSNQNFR